MSPGQVRARIVSDSKVSIDLAEQRSGASTNVALVQQCRQVLKACRDCGRPGKRQRRMRSPGRREPLTGGKCKWWI